MTNLRSNFVSPNIRQKIYQLDNHKCVYCGCQVEKGKNATLDHIKPRSLYPELERDIKNLVTSCVKCNSKKGNMTTFQFLFKVMGLSYRQAQIRQKSIYYRGQNRVRKMCLMN